MSDKSDSIKALAIHLLLIFALVFGAILLFFYVYLPFTTNHGESITVPSVIGKDYEEMVKYLEERDLRYEVTTDSGYSANQKPFTVLKQYPVAGKKVKENRKIYVTLNRSSAPKVKMPYLSAQSAKNAQLMLKSMGLESELVYKPNPFQNLVLNVQVNGKDAPEGTMVTLGSKVTLIVGNGRGEEEFDVPTVVGENKADAETILLGSGLNIGTIRTEKADGKAPGTVIRQSPESGKVKAGTTVDIWIVEGDAENSVDNN
jgi:eukaryotic-like serine/threonine-protein kinase